MPLADDCVDVIISNCVINLSADKPAVCAEAARAAPGGRFAVTDVVSIEEMDAATRSNLERWTRGPPGPGDGGGGWGGPRGPGR